MKRIILTLSLILHFFCLFNLNSCQISTHLWSKEYLSEINSASFINDDHVLLSSTKGNLVNLRFKNGEPVWNKNFLYANKFTVESNEKCKIYYFLNLKDSLVINNDNGTEVATVDIIENKNSALIKTLNFSKKENNILNLSINTIENTNYVIIATSKSLSVFNIEAFDLFELNFNK